MDAEPVSLRDKLMNYLSVPVGEFGHSHGRQFLHRRLQLRLLRLAKGGREPPVSARISRRRPIVQWCEGPVPRLAPHPKPPILGLTDRCRAIIPALWVSAPEKAASAAPWHPSATVPEIGPSASHPSPAPPRPHSRLIHFLCKFTALPCAFHLGVV